MKGTREKAAHQALSYYSFSTPQTFSIQPNILYLKAENIVLLIEDQAFYLVWFGSSTIVSPSCEQVVSFSFFITKGRG